MKLSKILIAAAASSVMLTSCYDLDRFPDSQMSSETFFKTEEHAKEAMMATYSIMQWDHVYGYAFAWDGLGGISAGYDNQSMRNIMRGTLALSNAYYTSKWSYCYEGIARANGILQKIDGIDDTDEIKNRYRAEARFMRAVYYWNLFKFYGGVPLYDESWDIATQYSEMLEPRATEEATRKFILDDIEAALALPREWPESDNGRATWGAAMAFKGKVLLFNKQYQEASNCFKAVIESNLYQLNASYEDLFQPEADACSEMIFSIQNIGGVGQDYGMGLAKFLGPNSVFGYGWNNCMPSTDFVDEYEWRDGSPFYWDDEFEDWYDYKYDSDKKTYYYPIRDKVFYSELNEAGTQVVKYTEYKDYLINMYSERDPRLNASIITPYSHYLGGCGAVEIDYEYVICPDMSIIPAKCGILKINANYPCYIWRKFVPKGLMNGGINNREDTPINYPLIRYADVLLMQAECLNELGDQPGAIALVNQVRQRPSVNMPPINNGDTWMAASTKQEVFDRIMHERRIELACEGHAFDDMRRWGKLEELNDLQENTILGRSIGQYPYDRAVIERDYLWPIPISEIDKNPKLTQNPGWE